MAYYQLMYEVMDELRKAQSDEERVAILKKNNSLELKVLLRGAFHPDISFAIKEAPDYRPNPTYYGGSGTGKTTIRFELKSIYLFEEKNPRVSPNLSQKRKTDLLIQILEYLEPKEAELFLGMILKDLKVPGLTYQVVKTAFPSLLP